MGNLPVEVTLTVDQWNTVVFALGEMPFSRVVAIISDIKRQADPKIAEAQAADNAEAA